MGKGAIVNYIVFTYILPQTVFSSFNSSEATKLDKQKRQKDRHALILPLDTKTSQVSGPVRKQIYGVLDDDDDDDDEFTL